MKGMDGEVHYDREVHCDREGCAHHSIYDWRPTRGIGKPFIPADWAVVKIRGKGAPRYHLCPPCARDLGYWLNTPRVTG